MRCSHERKIRELKATILEQGKEIIALQEKLKSKAVKFSFDGDYCRLPPEVFIGGVKYINAMQSEFEKSNIRQEAFAEKKILRDEIKELQDKLKAQQMLLTHYLKSM